MADIPVNQQQGTQTQQNIQPPQSAPTPQGTPAPQDPQDIKSLYNKKPTFTNQLRLVKTMVTNMQTSSPLSLMLGGDTGLGKTSFVRQMSKVFGLPVIIIEVPHIIEEKLINIPFIIDNARGNSSSGAEQFNKDTGVRIGLGKSYLASELEKIHKLSDAEYAAAVKSYSPYLQALIEQINDTLPGKIDLIRLRYSRILFIDEFYRKTSQTIRNILRNLLNRRVGDDPISDDTFIMYASNLIDVAGSIESNISSSAEMSGHPEFNPPSKEEWLYYIISEALGEKVSLKKAVIDEFDRAVKDEHMSFNDVAAQIRISPRRWSEIFVYINNHYPFKSPETAGILLTTLERQFQSDMSNDIQTSGLVEVVREMIANLAEKSNIDPKTINPISATEWRKVLAQQILTSIESGKMKKYVPVLQGLPGIGKTSSIAQIFEAPPYNLRFISILATTLSKDSISGIPLPEEEAKKLGVTFAEPTLYHTMINLMRSADENYFNRLKEKQASNTLNGKTAEEVYKNFKNQKYKYIILIDEINRVSDVTVFNSLRQLILDKKFNEQYYLPDDCLIVGAMNPGDVGTTKLTSHFRDAVDLIDVEPNWVDTFTYIKSVADREKVTNNINDVIIRMTLNILDEFPKTFCAKKERLSDLTEFYLTFGAEPTITKVYFSPRKYVDLFSTLAVGLNDTLNSIQHRISNKNQKFTDQEVAQELVTEAAQTIVSSVKEALYRNKPRLMMTQDFINRTYDMLEPIISSALVKVVKTSTLDPILLSAIDGKTSLDASISFDNYMSGFDPMSFSEDFRKFLMNTYREFDSLDDIEKFDKDMSTLTKQMILATESPDWNDITDSGQEILDKVKIEIGHFLDGILLSPKKKSDEINYRIGASYRNLMRSIDEATK